VGVHHYLLDPSTTLLFDRNFTSETAYYTKRKNGTRVEDFCVREGLNY